MDKTCRDRAAASRKLLARIGFSILALGVATAAAPPPKTEMIGAWHYETGADPMTDAPRYTAYIKADESDSRGAVFLVMCTRERSIQLGVKTGSFIGNKHGSRTFLYRLDDKPVVTDRWNYLSGNVVGKDLRDNAVGFLTELAHAKRLRIRAIRTDGTQIDSDFILGDPLPAISRLATDCKFGPIP